MRYIKDFPAHNLCPHQKAASTISTIINGVCKEDAELTAPLQVSPTELAVLNGSFSFSPSLQFP